MHKLKRPIVAKKKSKITIAASASPSNAPSFHANVQATIHKLQLFLEKSFLPSIAQIVCASSEPCVAGRTKSPQKQPHLARLKEHNKILFDHLSALGRFLDQHHAGLRPKDQRSGSITLPSMKALEALSGKYVNDTLYHKRVEEIVQLLRSILSWYDNSWRERILTRVRVCDHYTTSIQRITNSVRIAVEGQLLPELCRFIEKRRADEAMIHDQYQRCLSESVTKRRAFYSTVATGAASQRVLCSKMMDVTSALMQEMQQQQQHHNKTTNKYKNKMQKQAADHSIDTGGSDQDQDQEDIDQESGQWADCVRRQNQLTDALDIWLKTLEDYQETHVLYAILPFILERFLHWKLLFERLFLDILDLSLPESQSSSSNNKYENDGADDGDDASAGQADVGADDAHFRIITSLESQKRATDTALYDQQSELDLLQIEFRRLKDVLQKRLSDRERISYTTASELAEEAEATTTTTKHVNKKKTKKKTNNTDTEDEDGEEEETDDDYDDDDIDESDKQMRKIDRLLGMAENMPRRSSQQLSDQAHRVSETYHLERSIERIQGACLLADKKMQSARPRIIALQKQATDLASLVAFFRDFDTKIVAEWKALIADEQGLCAGWTQDRDTYFETFVAHRQATCQISDLKAKSVLSELLRHLSVSFARLEATHESHIDAINRTFSSNIKLIGQAAEMIEKHHRNITIALPDISVELRKFTLRLDEYVVERDEVDTQVYQFEVNDVIRKFVSALSQLVDSIVTDKNLELFLSRLDEISASNALAAWPTPVILSTDTTLAWIQGTDIEQRLAHKRDVDRTPSRHVDDDDADTFVDGDEHNNKTKVHFGSINSVKQTGLFVDTLKQLSKATNASPTL